MSETMRESPGQGDEMAEIFFYHLTQNPLEETLSVLLEKTLNIQWRACLRVNDNNLLTFLDTYLWRYQKDSFLPHAISPLNDAPDQPIQLGASLENPTNAHALIIVESATLRDEDLRNFKRISLVFNEADHENLNAARQYWKDAKAKNAKAKYFSQETGQWRLKAEN